MSLEPPPDHPTPSALDYRRALGAFATGVCVVTARTPEAMLGITINSFASVSLDPRLVLWCLDERSDRWPVFAAADGFAIHVLGAEGEALARRFASGPCDLDDPAELDRMTVARFDCRAHERIQMGDHMIIVGAVDDFTARDGAALGFHRGRYGVVSEDRA